MKAKIEIAKVILGAKAELERDAKERYPDADDMEIEDMVEKILVELETIPD